MDQVVLLIKNIKNFLETKNKKTNAIFANLAAAYDITTSYKLGFSCKLLRFLGKCMVRIIMELVRNRSFTLTNGDSKQNKK